MKTLDEALKDLLEMEPEDREKFITTCKIESCSHHNDGWVMEHYKTYVDAAKHLEGVK